MHAHLIQYGIGTNKVIAITVKLDDVFPLDTSTVGLQLFRTNFLITGTNPTKLHSVYLGSILSFLIP